MEKIEVLTVIVVAITFLLTFLASRTTGRGPSLTTQGTMKVTTENPSDSNQQENTSLAALQAAGGGKKNGDVYCVNQQ